MLIYFVYFLISEDKFKGNLANFRLSKKCRKMIVFVVYFLNGWWLNIIEWFLVTVEIRDRKSIFYSVSDDISTTPHSNTYSAMLHKNNEIYSIISWDKY